MSESSYVLPINDQNFQTEVLDQGGKVLVDFWAPWCGPCRALAPILEQVAKANPGVKFCSLNVDDNPESATQYDVMSLPTLHLFQGGKIVDTFVGLQDAESLEAKILKA